MAIGSINTEHLHKIMTECESCKNKKELKILDPEKISKTRFRCEKCKQSLEYSSTDKEKNIFKFKPAVVYLRTYSTTHTPYY